MRATKRTSKRSLPAHCSTHHHASAAAHLVHLEHHCCLAVLCQQLRRRGRHEAAQLPQLPLALLLGRCWRGALRLVVCGRQGARGSDSGSAAASNAPRVTAARGVRATPRAGPAAAALRTPAHTRTRTGGVAAHALLNAALTLLAAPTARRCTLR
jgi:hypothetical protein